MLDLRNSKILITGATGFVGSHLTEKILEHNPKILVCLYQDLNPKSYFSFKNLFNRAIMVQADVRDYNRILKTLIKYDIDIVFHLAAQPIVEIAYKLPLETISTNVMGTATILEAARMKNDLRAVIIASSDKAYGKAQTLPYREDHHLKGDHPYDVSKTAADLVAQTYFKTYGLPIAVTRFGNIFGRGDLNFNRLIPGVLESVILKKEFLVRSDGKMVREYVPVEDVVSGYLKILENIENARGEAFNFGSKNVMSVIEAIQEIGRILETEVDHRILNVAKNEIPRQYLDWNKAREMLNWQPMVSFSDGIKKAFSWYRDFYFK